MDSSGVPVASIAVELRSASGRILAVVHTAPDGTFTFGGPVVVPGAPYYVVPVPDPSEVFNPSVVYVPPSSTPSINFVVSGGSGHMRVSGLVSGTFVLATFAPYTQLQPPTIDPTQAQYSTMAFSAVAGFDGVARLQMPPGFSYFLTCWKPVNATNTTAFLREPASGSYATAYPVPTVNALVPVAGGAGRFCQ